MSRVSEYIIAGTSGLAVEYFLTVDALRLLYLGCVGPDHVDISKCLFPYLGDDDVVNGYPNAGVIIAVGDPQIKYNISKVIQNQETPPLIHPKAYCSRVANQIGYASVIQPYAVMTGGITIGPNTLVNQLVSIGHNAKIGSCCTINPVAAISGDVMIGDRVLVGTGANILEGITIGDDAIVGAGAVVTKDVESGTTVVGVPAKPINRDM